MVNKKTENSNTCTPECNVIQCNSPAKSTTLKVFVETTFSPPNTKRLDPLGRKNFLVVFMALIASSYWTHLECYLSMLQPWFPCNVLFTVTLILYSKFSFKRMWSLFWYKPVHVRTGLDWINLFPLPRHHQRGFRFFFLTHFDLDLQFREKLGVFGLMQLISC